MADAAWTIVQRYDRPTDTVVEMSISESSIATMDLFVPDPDTPMDRAGVQTLLTLFNGTQIFVIDRKIELDAVFKSKVP
jgi:hypothetical protein